MTSRSPCDAGSRARGRERSSRKRPTYTSGSPLSGVFYLRALSLSRSAARSLARWHVFSAAPTHAHMHADRPTVAGTTGGPETESLDSRYPRRNESFRRSRARELKDSRSRHKALIKITYSDDSIIFLLSEARRRRCLPLHRLHAGLFNLSVLKLKSYTKKHNRIHILLHGKNKRFC